MIWLDGMTDFMDMSLSRLWELVIDRESKLAAVHSVTKSRTQLSMRTFKVNITVIVEEFIEKYLSHQEHKEKN